MQIKTFEINDHTVEFFPDTHTYIVDGIITPCVSNILAYKFNDYAHIPKGFLQRSSEKGIELHQAIEDYERYGEPSDLTEFRNYIYLKNQYGFKNIANELPVLFTEGDRAVFVGTLDQVIEIDGKCGINDFKRVTAPNKKKITYQLNFYRMAYEQTYGRKIEFLSFTHLKEDVMRFHYLPINEEMAVDLLNEFLEERYRDEN